MKKLGRKLMALCMMVVLLVNVTMSVNAATVSEYMYGYYCSGTVTATRSTANAYGSAEPESSTEPDIYVTQVGWAYQAGGNRIATLSTSGWRSCSKSVRDLVDVAYAECTFTMDGTTIGTARGNA